MKHLQTHKFRLFILTFLAFSSLTFAQKETKTYKESFKVNNDVVIDINTSHADIVFETWNKDVVEVEATLEVEGLSKEELEDYFKSWNFEAVGNSSKVSISTRPRHWEFRNNNVTVVSTEDVDFDFHVVPDVDVEEIITPFIVEIPELPPLPPLPLNFENLTFDYEAYKKDGDKYLEEWKKSFSENFNEDFKEHLEEWKLHVEERRKVIEEHKKDMEHYRKDIQHKREEAREELLEKRELAREEMHKIREKQRIIIRNEREKAREAREDMIIEMRKSGRSPRIFRFSSEGSKKDLKVNKTIKIKMPKGARLKMNVRHGEVKLAANYNNIDATLSHTKLFASVVDGKNSIINASYSPVKVDNWNYGELKVNYVKDVDLKNVKSVKLVSKSSDVVIGTLSEDAIINCSFGNLDINNIENNFKHLEIVLDNSDTTLRLPTAIAYDFYCSASDSKIKYPERLVLDVSEKYSNQQAKGYNLNKSSNKNVSIVSTFSDVKIE